MTYRITYKGKTVKEYKCIQKDLKQYLEKWGVK